MDFALTILGVSGAAPAYGRFPSSQVLQIQNCYFLIDCGEGAQIQMDRYCIPRNRIDQIFISHLHGDHIFGLPGLIFSFALNNRKKLLQIYSPPGSEGMIRAQLPPDSSFPFPLEFIELNTSSPQQIFENSILKITSIPLKHRIPTCGFLFEEKAFLKNIIPEKIQELGLDYGQIKAIKQGRGIEIGSVTLRNEDLTFPAIKCRSYAYISDTAYAPEIVPYISKVNILYHESTFCEKDAERAASTLHSTANMSHPEF